MMIGNVRVKDLRTEVFIKLLQLSKACIGRGMRPALVVPYLREILVMGGTSRAETRLLARTDEQLYTWFRICFLNAKSRIFAHKLGEKVDETRRDKMAATLSVVSLMVERRPMPGQTSLPVEQEQRYVEAEPEVEHAHKKRRVAQLEVVEPLVRNIENWQPGGLGLGATSPSGTSKEKLNSGEETVKRISRSK